MQPSSFNKALAIALTKSAKQDRGCNAVPMQPSRPRGETLLANQARLAVQACRLLLGDHIAFPKATKWHSRLDLHDMPLLCPIRIVCWERARLRLGPLGVLLLPLQRFPGSRPIGVTTRRRFAPLSLLLPSASSLTHRAKDVRRCRAGSGARQASNRPAECKCQKLAAGLWHLVSQPTVPSRAFRMDGHGDVKFRIYAWGSCYPLAVYS